MNKHSMSLINHEHSATSKAHGHGPRPLCDCNVGDLVYVITDKRKHHPRDRYLVTSVDGIWCKIRKFVGSQLRSNAQKVLRSEIYQVGNDNSRISKEEEKVTGPQPLSKSKSQEHTCSIPDEICALLNDHDGTLTDHLVDRSPSPRHRQQKTSLKIAPRSPPTQDAQTEVAGPLST